MICSSCTLQTLCCVIHWEALFISWLLPGEHFPFLHLTSTHISRLSSVSLPSVGPLTLHYAHQHSVCIFTLAFSSLHPKFTIIKSSNLFSSKVPCVICLYVLSSLSCKLLESKDYVLFSFLPWA